VKKLHHLIIVASILFSVGNLYAENLSSVVDESKQINTSAAKSQITVDSIAAQIQDKLQAFKVVNKETDGLKIYNTQMEKQITAQLAEMVKINNSIDQVTVIERQITPLMIRMIEALDELIRFDIPFLEDERKQRLVNLKSMMDRADVAVSEKFRRVFEAYQVEIDYGRTIESYAGSAAIEGVSQEVNFLRIGRIALIYQSRDRNSMGIWSQEEKQWKPLDNEYRIEVTKGIRMAEKQLAPDMIVVPVPTAVAKEL